MSTRADEKAPPVPGAAGPPGSVMTVTELTERIRARLAGDPRFAHVAVTGEVAAYRAHSASGHHYFTLKDRMSRIACVMFRSQAQHLAFSPGEGMQVVATGYVDVYPQGGAYQLYVQGLYPVGLGLLFARLRELAARLEQEGLFDPARKRPLPAWPRRVGIVTSPDGAALRDIMAVFRRRSPHTPLVLAPAQVQGDGAAGSVVSALGQLSRCPGVDVVIVARGGGAADELWVFNDERIVRAVAGCPRPVVCAVGHETDVTLAELAADRRAPTPSAAAEMAAPDEAAAEVHVVAVEERLLRAAGRAMRLRRERVERAALHWTLARPERWLAGFRQQLDEMKMRLERATARAIEEPGRRLANLVGRLDAQDPLRVLERGFSLVFHEPSGRWIRRAGEAVPGDDVAVRMWDGVLHCRVKDRETEPAAGAAARGRMEVPEGHGG